MSRVRSKRLKWAVAGCLLLIAGPVLAEAGKPRNILEFLFGTRRAEQPAAIAPAAPQSIAPSLYDARPRADKDRKATRKTTSKQGIDGDDDGERKNSRSLRKGKVSPIDPEKRVASGTYSGPFRGAGNQAYCVRSCDGFFFPVNHEGAQGGDRYESVCQQSCPGAQTQVYFMKRGGDIRYSSTARGTPYASLENALKYRKERDPACTCKSQEQRWSSILTNVEQKIRHNKTDLVITEEISQRIAQGEDALAILKGNVQQAKGDGDDTARRADAAVAASALGGSPAIRASFGSRITPADRFIKIDPEPTGSIPDKARDSSPAKAEPKPAKPQASLKQQPSQQPLPPARPIAAKQPEKPAPDKTGSTTIDRLALRQTLDRLGAPQQR